MFAHQRHQTILGALKAGSEVTTSELQAMLQASAPTIRRDLAFLSDLGRVVRTHGGAIDPAKADQELSFDRKSRAALKAKSLLARAAAALVKGGQTVFVDAGSTAFEVGKQLLQLENLVIFTNSIPLLSERAAPGVRVVSIGGEVRQISLALVGGETSDWIRKIRLDVAFLGASGLDLNEGPTTTEFSEAGIKQAVVYRARRTVVVADASKWDRPATICYARWGQIHDLITDHQPTPSEQTAFAAHGTQIHCANPR